MYGPAVSEYLFPAWIPSIGCGVVAVICLLYTLITGNRSTIHFWFFTWLAVMDISYSLGGYLFIRYWAIPIILLSFIVGYIIYRKKLLIKRIALGYILVTVAVMLVPRIYNIDRSCKDEPKRLDPVVHYFDNTRDPYDFALVKIPDELRSAHHTLPSRLLLSTHGTTEAVRWFDAKTSRFLAKTPFKEYGTVQRLTPSKNPGIVIGSPWGTRANETQHILFFDATSFSISGKIPVEGCVHLFEVVEDPAKDVYYALCETSHTLVRIEKGGEKQTVVKLPGRDAYDMVFDPVRRRIITTDWWSPNITLVNADTMTVEKTVPIGWSSFGILIHRDKIYVARPLANEVVEMDGETLQILRRLDAGYGVRDIEVDGQRDILFAGNYFDGTVDAFDLVSGKRIRRAYVGKLMRGLIIDTVRDRLYLGTGCGIKFIFLFEWLHDYDN